MANSPRDVLSVTRASESPKAGTDSPPSSLSELAADGYEVASIFSAPLAIFLPGAPIEIVTADRDGYRLRYGGYRVGRHHVWGATAMMLGRLGAWLGREASMQTRD